MRRILIALTGLLVLACAKEETYGIKGTADGFADGTEIYLEELGANNKRNAVDTAVVATGTFVFSKPRAAGSGIQIVSTKESKDQLLIVKDTSPLEIVLYKDSLAASLVTGSIENELFNTYRNSSRQLNTKKTELRRLMRKAQTETDGVMVEMYGDQIKKMDADFITDKKAVLEANPDKMVSVVALSDLINAKVLTVEDTETYYNGLAASVKESPIGISVKNYVAQLKSQKIASKLASVGNQAPAFSAETPDGKQLALSETLGKYTIVDFWASWCRPCRMENPNVVRVYNKYHDKGLNIISVSLDRPGQKERWIKAIEKDEMDWYHVSNLQFWQDPIPRSYGVRAIPATFLLDEKGFIIAKDLRGQALEAKMDELLGAI